MTSSALRKTAIAHAGEAHPSADILDFYTRQSPISDPGCHAAELARLPADPEELVRAAQHTMIYEHVAGDFYGIALSGERRAESHIRPVVAMFDRVKQLDDAPLGAPRPGENRLVAICRSFTLMAVSLMRAHGIPARARCGFGTYFNPGHFEDHWVCEYWSAAAGLWKLADIQFDAVWRERFKLDHDVMDVPRDRFLVAADAWQLCRSGKADPDRFGIGFWRLRGLWFVAGDLMRDLAALNGMEMLAWDSWGAMPAPGWQPKDEEIAFFDRVAAVTRDPDATFDELSDLYASDERLRVPATVFNALRQRMEPVAT